MFRLTQKVQCIITHTYTQTSVRACAHTIPIRCLPFERMENKHSKTLISLLTHKYAFIRQKLFSWSQQKVNEQERYRHLKRKKDWERSRRKINDWEILIVQPKKHVLLAHFIRCRCSACSLAREPNTSHFSHYCWLVCIILIFCFGFCFWNFLFSVCRCRWET